MLQKGREGYKSSSLLSRAGSNIFLLGTTTKKNNNSACLELDSSREDNSSDNCFWRAKMCPILSITNQAALWGKKEEKKIAGCMSWTWIVSSVILEKLLIRGTRVSGGHLNNPSATALCLDLTWNGPVVPWSGKCGQRGSFFNCWLACGWWPQ